MASARTASAKRRRRTELTSIERLWSRIEAWRSEKGASQKLRPAATKAALAKLEKAIGTKLAADHRASLAIHDGGGDFESYAYLDDRDRAVVEDLPRRREEEAAAAVDPRAHTKWWEDAWVPFAADSAGNLLCVDTRRGAIVELESQDNQGAFVRTGTTFTDWLDDHWRKLKRGALVVDAEGFVGEPVIEPLVKAGSKPAELELEPSDALERAIADDDVAAVAKALSRVAVGTTLIFERSVAGCAAEKGSFRVLRHLLEQRGEDVNDGEGRGARPPLFWAVWGEHPKLEIVRYLLARGAHVNAMTGYDGTPVHAAVMWDQVDALALMIAAGADLTLQDAKKRTPFASARPDQKRVRALLKPR